MPNPHRASRIKRAYFSGVLRVGKAESVLLDYRGCVAGGGFFHGRGHLSFQKNGIHVSRTQSMRKVDDSRGRGMDDGARKGDKRRESDILKKLSCLKISL